VRGDGRIVGFCHAGDEADFGDASGVAEVRLDDLGGFLFEDFAEAPLGEDALASGDGDVGAFGDVGHDVVVLTVDRLFDEHRIVLFELLDEDAGQGGTDAAVEVDADVGFVAYGFAKFGEALDDVVDFGWGFHVTVEVVAVGSCSLCSVAAYGPGLERCETFGHLGSHLFWGASVGVDANFVAGGAAEEFVSLDCNKPAKIG